MKTRPLKWLCPLITTLALLQTAAALAAPLDALMVINHAAETGSTEDREHWITVQFVAYDEWGRLVVVVDHDADVGYFQDAMLGGETFDSLSLRTSDEAVAGEQVYFHIVLTDATVASIEFDATGKGATVKLSPLVKAGDVTLKRGTF